MNKALVRIRRSYAPAYYRRLFGIAWQETRRRLTVLTITSVAFVVLNVLFARLFTNQGVGAGFEIGFASVGTLWFLVGLWFFFTIPPRIEFDLQRKEESLQVLSQRRQLAIDLRNHMVECRMAAQQARDREIAANGQGGTVVPDAYHQTALKAAHEAGERLERFGKQTGQSSYQERIIEISGAVNTKKCATADEAIAQLEALADVFERQLSSGVYW